MLEAKTMMKAIWLGIFFAVLIWSAIAPKDYPTWWLEVLPALIGLAIMAFSYKKFPLTPLVYGLILFHCVILMVGGHYTYAEVPLFDWIRDTFEQSRNNYDKVGHFAQGFVPVMIARELLIRKNIVNGRGWMHFLSVCFVLAFSAFYELIEWWVAAINEGAAEAFLGTQGYIWDTQSDMMWALIGGIIGLLALARIHDRQITALNSTV
jgi:putative membrane protein